MKKSQTDKKMISIHALREEGDELFLPVVNLQTQFLSTPSARRATLSSYPLDSASAIISIHALREEGDAPAPRHPTQHRDFYPRPPRGGRRIPHAQSADRKDISIHALREEGDHPSRSKRR